jgi:hypothetical protein
MENKEAHQGQQTHTIPRHGSGRWIIHLFLTFFLRSVTTAVLGLTVGLLPLRGLAVSSLSFPVMMTPCRNPTFITAVGLTPKTTPADTEKNVTPLALDLTQQQNRHPLSDLQSPENRRILLSSVLGFLDWLSKKRPEVPAPGLLSSIVFHQTKILPKTRTKSKAKAIVTKCAGRRAYSTSADWSCPICKMIRQQDCPTPHSEKYEDLDML